MINVINLNKNKRAVGYYIGRKMPNRNASALANPFKIADNKSLYQDVDHVYGIIEPYARANRIEDPKEIRKIARRISGKAMEIGTNDPPKARGSTLAFYKAWLWELMQRDTAAKSELYIIARDAIGGGKAIDLLCWCSPEPCHGDIVKASVEWILTQDDRVQHIVANY